MRSLAHHSEWSEGSSGSGLSGMPCLAEDQWRAVAIPWAPAVWVALIPRALGSLQDPSFICRASCCSRLVFFGRSTTKQLAVLSTLNVSIIPVFRALLAFIVTTRKGSFLECLLYRDVALKRAGNGGLFLRRKIVLIVLRNHCRMTHC